MCQTSNTQVITVGKFLVGMDNFPQFIQMGKGFKDIEYIIDSSPGMADIIIQHILKQKLRNALLTLEFETAANTQLVILATFLRWFGEGDRLLGGEQAEDAVVQLRILLVQLTSATTKLERHVDESQNKWSNINIIFFQ